MYQTVYWKHHVFPGQARSSQLTHQHGVKVRGHGQLVQFVLAVGEGEVRHGKSARRGHACAGAWRGRGRRGRRQSSVAVENHLGGGGGGFGVRSRHCLHSRVLVHVPTRRGEVVSALQEVFRANAVGIDCAMSSLGCEFSAVGFTNKFFGLFAN